MDSTNLHSFAYGGSKPEVNTKIEATPEPEPEVPTYNGTSRFSPPPVITFEKVVADGTKYRIGAVWTWSYKHLMEHEAFNHALKHLKGEGEDPLHWKRLP